MDKYTEKIIHYMNNQKFNKIPEEYTRRIYFKSKVCGDTNIIYIKENGEGKIEEIGYENSGCSMNVLSLEIFCEISLGKFFEKIKEINLREIVSGELEIPKEKEHCIQLVEESLINGELITKD